MSLDAELTQAALVSEWVSTLYNLANLVYRVPEVRTTLELLARYHGVDNWRDVI